MMKRNILLAGAAMLAISASPALANCADEIAMLSGDMQDAGQATGAVGEMDQSQPGVVSKDGSLAPLETPDDAATTGGSASIAPSGTEAGGETTMGATGSGAVESSQSADAGTGTAASGNATAGSGEIVKDGQTMPLAQEYGGGPSETAMSQQDAVSQQGGGETAAAAAGQGNVGGGTRDGASGNADFMAALDRARTLQAQGDEAGCMEAVEEARALRGG